MLSCRRGGFYLAEFDTLQALVLRLLQQGAASEGQLEDNRQFQTSMPVAQNGTLQRAWRTRARWQ